MSNTLCSGNTPFIYEPWSFHKSIHKAYNTLKLYNFEYLSISLILILKLVLTGAGEANNWELWLTYTGMQSSNHVRFAAILFSDYLSATY